MEEFFYVHEVHLTERGAWVCCILFHISYCWSCASVLFIFYINTKFLLPISLYMSPHKTWAFYIKKWIHIILLHRSLRFLPWSICSCPRALLPLMMTGAAAPWTSGSAAPGCEGRRPWTWVALPLGAAPLDVKAKMAGPSCQRRLDVDARRCCKMPGRGSTRGMRGDSERWALAKDAKRRPLDTEGG